MEKKKSKGSQQIPKAVNSENFLELMDVGIEDLQLLSQLKQRQTFLVFLLMKKHISTTITKYLSLI